MSKIISTTCLLIKDLKYYMYMMLIFKKINSFVLFGIGGTWSVTIHLSYTFDRLQKTCWYHLVL